MKTLLFILLSALLDISVACASRADTGIHIKEIRKGKAEWINPLLDCYDLGSSNLREMIELERMIQSTVNRYLQDHRATDISVYYRDLMNGHWIGIKENDKYSPASLLKLPFFIAALKQAEEDPSFLYRQVTAGQYNRNMIQNLGNNNFALEPGRLYTLNEILTDMIVYSDNQCKDILAEHLGDKYLFDVFYDLGIDIDKVKENEDFITVKQYASFFRILYNATYLNKYSSNYALNILTKSRFKLGLVAGVPDSIIVAHKFGEREFKGSTIKQLHDCGIVYAPNNPYLICIMVKGESFETIEKIIASINKQIFDFIQKKPRRTQ